MPESDEGRWSALRFWLCLTKHKDHFLEDKALTHFVTIFLTALAAIVLFSYFSFDIT